MKPIEEMTTEELLNLSDEDQAKAFMNGVDNPDGDKESKESPDLAKEAEAGEVKEEVKEEPVILARDGKNTIPYSELESAREREKQALLHAKELEESLKSKDQLIADLKEAKKLDAETGSTEEQQKVLDEYAGEFPELMEDIKPFLEGMINKGIAVGIKTLKDEIAKDIEPVRQKVEKAEQDAIADDHKAWSKAQSDFFAVNKVFQENKVLYDYLNGAVKMIAADETNTNLTYQGVLDKAKDMVTEAINKMNGAISGKTPKPEDVKKKAEEIIAKTEETPPFSLSDVPGSSAAHHDESAALESMSTTARMDKFMSMNPDKIEDMLSKLL